MTREQAAELLRGAELVLDMPTREGRTWRVWRTADDREWYEFESNPDTSEYTYSLRLAKDRA